MSKEFNTEKFTADVTFKLLEAGERDITCHEEKCEKLNESYNALTFAREETGISLNINLDQIEEALDRGMPYEEILDNTVNAIISGLSDENINSIKGLTADALSYDAAKANLAIDIVSVKGHEDILNKVPHRIMEDLAAVYRIIVSMSDECHGSVLITNRMLESMGVTREQLIADAEAVAPRSRPMRICSMTDMFRELMKKDDTPEEVIDMLIPEDGIPLYVATVEDNIQGAGILAYPEFFSTAAEYMGGDFFILPSSVHELLLLRDTGETSVEDLKSMVTSVNAGCVAPKDRLTDNVYHYDVQAGLFETGDNYIRRNSRQANG